MVPNQIVHRSPKMIESTKIEVYSSTGFHRFIQLRYNGFFSFNMFQNIQSKYVVIG